MMVYPAITQASRNSLDDLVDWTEVRRQQEEERRFKLLHKLVAPPCAEHDNYTTDQEESDGTMVR